MSLSKLHRCRYQCRKHHQHFSAFQKHWWKKLSVGKPIVRQMLVEWRLSTKHCIGKMYASTIIQMTPTVSNVHICICCLFSLIYSHRTLLPDLTNRNVPTMPVFTWDVSSSFTDQTAAPIILLQEREEQRQDRCEKRMNLNKWDN